MAVVLSGCVARAGAAGHVARAAVAELDAQTALATARVVAAQVSGAHVLSVAANREMRPVFEKDAFLIVQPARADSLRVGDMVAYEHPTRHELVVQRVLGSDDQAAAAAAGSSLTRVFAILYYQNDVRSPSSGHAVEMIASANDHTPVAAAAASAR